MNSFPIPTLSPNSTLKIITCRHVQARCFLFYNITKSDDGRGRKGVESYNSELKQTTTTTVTRAPPNKRFNERKNWLLKCLINLLSSSAK